MLLSCVRVVNAQSALTGDPIHITRAPASIAVDGDLGDEGWRGATKIEACPPAWGVNSYRLDIDFIHYV